MEKEDRKVTNGSKLMVRDPFPHRLEFALRLRHVRERSKKSKRIVSSGKERENQRVDEGGLGFWFGFRGNLCIYIYIYLCTRI